MIPPPRRVQEQPVPKGIDLKVVARNAKIKRLLEKFDQTVSEDVKPTRTWWLCQVVGTSERNKELMIQVTRRRAAELVTMGHPAGDSVEAAYHDLAEWLWARAGQEGLDL